MFFFVVGCMLEGVWCLEDIVRVVMALMEVT